jgi:SAM-dependent methyltransferase
VTSSNRDLIKAAQRGEPSYVWRAGQERRFAMILEAAGDRIAGRVLDNGCGVGTYLQNMAERAPKAHGIEFEYDRAQAAHNLHDCVVQAAGERLPYPDGSFDFVLSMEVLEHVDNDRLAMEEIARVLRAPSVDALGGGRAVIFVPNRGYPFETHGFFWHGEYRFGNIPLINYLPTRYRDRLAPHVRAYRSSDLERLIKGLPLRIHQRTIIFGAYDNIIARWPRLGRTLRRILQGFEKTPLRALGLSHFWVLERA